MEQNIVAELTMIEKAAFYIDTMFRCCIAEIPSVLYAAKLA